ncbi:MAG: hypothetical protein K0R12_473 [Gammaproteobacteria bacterium]|jgi:putative OPT family oligopeptide transporter|nr:hypothetical protein [Gammaproteobacteria bacterium]
MKQKQGVIFLISAYAGMKGEKFMTLSTKSHPNKYFIPPEVNLPEITPKVIVIVIFLTIFLAASNTYLGLKVGLTITGSIPAAVIAMGILRFFKQHNVLENNIAQTAVSAGSIIISGLIFTIPATLIMGAWTHIEYWPTMAITLLGGILGVLFSIPLRRVLLDNPTLTFPEGLAVGEVLKHSAGEKMGLGTLLTGGALGAVISVGQIGLKVVSSGISYWTKIGPSLYGIGLGFSPALIGAGFIVGLSVAMSMLIGVVLGWIIGVPLISAHHGIPSDLIGHASGEIAYFYWSHYIRYIGIGTIMVGSIWAVICLIKPMAVGIKSSLGALRKRTADSGAMLRTERDISIQKVLIGSVIAIILIFFMMLWFTKEWAPELTTTQGVIFSLLSAAIIYGLGFVVSAICGYFAGLVGSSISPISSMILIATILTSLLMLGISFLWHLPSAELATMTILVVLMNAVIAAVASVSNDTMQDLKAGQIIGATPWKQQVMLFVGVVIAALILPVVMQLLYQAYGLGGVFPRPGMDPSQMLLAPQASLVAAVTQGVFALSLPWGLIGSGVGIALLVLVLDRILRPYGLHLHVLGVGIGIYLPFESTIPLILGGIAAGLVTHLTKKHLPKQPVLAAAKYAEIQQRGLLAGCGLVAGAALAGVGLAIPFAIAGSSNILNVGGAGFKPYADLLGLFIAAGLVYWIYRVSTKIAW